MREFLANVLIVSAWLAIFVTLTAIVGLWLWTIIKAATGWPGDRDDA